MTMRMPEMLTPPPPSAARRNAKSADAFRTISEVAQELEVPQHVLRFWESKFPQVKPLKRAGGRRYYRPDDVLLLRRIRQCLYEQGYTSVGCAPCTTLPLDPNDPRSGRWSGRKLECGIHVQAT